MAVIAIAVSDFTVKGGLGLLPSGVMMFFFTASATVSERSTRFTACSNCSELMRFSPLRKKSDKDESNLDTVALLTNHNHKLVQSYFQPLAFK